VRQLKWSLRKDGLARIMRARPSPELYGGKHTDADDAFVSPDVARALLPAIRQLQWSLRRDRLAKMVRDRADGGDPSAASWIVSRGMIVGESERVRLAVCPGVKQIVNRYERMASNANASRETSGARVITASVRNERTATPSHCLLCLP
jgi:hypothetical protein